jgi:beta-lactamase class A
MGKTVTRAVQTTVRAVVDRDPELMWSVSIRDERGTVLGSHLAAKQLSTASVGKLLLLIEVARWLVADPAFGQTEVSRDAVEPVQDSGLLQHLQLERISVSDLAVLVASVSDNLATNLLLATVGLDAVERLTGELGLRRTALLDQVRDERGPEHPPTLSSGAAEELSQLMVEIHDGNLVGPAVSAQVREWLSMGVDVSMVASAFGLDPLAHTAADSELAFFNKTGSDHGIRADVGLTEGPEGAIAYAVIANWEAGDPGRLDGVLSGMREIGTAIRRETTN